MASAFDEARQRYSRALFAIEDHVAGCPRCQATAVVSAHLHADLARACPAAAPLGQEAEAAFAEATLAEMAEPRGIWNSTLALDHDDPDRLVEKLKALLVAEGKGMGAGSEDPGDAEG